jgi:hypothetical protein
MTPAPDAPRRSTTALKYAILLVVFTVAVLLMVNNLVDAFAEETKNTAPTGEAGPATSTTTYR